MESSSLGTLFGKQNIQAKELVYLIRQYCRLSTVWNSSRMERRAPYVIPKGSCVLYLWKHMVQANDKPIAPWLVCYVFSIQVM